MTKSLKITLIAGAWLFLVYALLRLGFYWSNRVYFEGAPYTDILMSFVYGLRYDFAGIVLINIPVLFLFNLPARLVEMRWYKRGVFLLFALSNAVGVIFNLVDFQYYPNVQRRSTFEPLERPQDFVVQVPGWIEEFPIFFFGGLAGVALLIVVTGLYFRRLDRKIPVKLGHVSGVGSGLFLIALSVLAIRGGLQPGIMRPADALIHSSSPAVGSMTLNSTYTVLLSRFLPRFHVIETMPEAEAGRIAAAMVKREGETLLDPRYPFYRVSAPKGKRKDLNIVILIQESWTWTHVGPDKHGVSRTPFFDSLTKEGAYFTNFLANGQRSAEAIPSVVASIPSLFRGPVIGSRVEMTTRFCGIGDLLGQFGYRCTLHHGASRTMEGFDGFRSLVGFDAYFCHETFEEEGPREETWDGKWGIYDELFYLDAGRRFSATNGPFVGVMFGLQPHDPYHVPPSRKKLFAEFAKEKPAHIAMRYSDHSVKTFFEYARNQPWFDQTIFFITADHTRRSLVGSFYESFHVPLLIYAPGIIEPQVRPEIGSHADIVPTILDLLEVETPHALMGRSLFDNEQTRYAVTTREGRYVIFDNERALMHDTTRDLGLYDYRKDLLFKNDLLSQEPERGTQLKANLMAWLQAVTSSIVNDRIWPRDALQKKAN